MNAKKILLVIPGSGGSRAVGETIAAALTQLGHPFAIFDCGKYERGLRELVKGDAGISEDILNQSLVVKAIEEEAHIVLVMALSPVTVYTLRVLKKAGKLTAHYFAEDLNTGNLWHSVAPEYGHFFVIQMGKWLALLQSRYNLHSHYLPHGAPMTGARPSPGSRLHQVIFVGAPYANRIAFFEELCRLGLPLSIWGEGWDRVTLSPGLRRCVVDGMRWLSSAEIASLYRKARIVLNLHSTLSGMPVDLDGDFANPRLFEVPLSGALQMVDRRKGIVEFYDDGIDVVTFASAQEAKEKAEFFLAHPEEAKRIADHAFEKTIKNHLWSHRLKTFFNFFDLAPAEENAFPVKEGILLAQEKAGKGITLNREERLYLMAAEVLTRASREEQGYV